MPSYVIPVFPAASRVPPRDALASRLAELTGRFAKLSSELAAVAAAVDSVSGKADKASPAAAGNLASLDASGNLADSGATPASIKAAAVAAVVNGADATMDTLKEIADILGSSQQSGTVLKRISDLESGKADGNALDGKRGLADLAVYEPAWDGTDGAQTYRFTLKSESPEVVLWATGDDPSTANRLMWWSDDGGYWTLYVNGVESGTLQQPGDALKLEFEVSGATWNLTRGVEKTADSIAKTSQIPDVTGNADKVAGATAGNLAALDAQGNLADSGVKPSDFAAKADLPYALVTPGEWEFSGVPDGVSNYRLEWDDGWFFAYYYEGESYGDSVSGAEDALELSFILFDSTITATRASLPGHLCDRAGNLVVVSGDTVLTLPELVNAGRLRDFLVRLEISGSTVPTITFAAPTGETITYETDGDEFPVPDEAGAWLYSFTESCVAHKFAVSLKKVNEVAAPQAQGGS